METLFDQMKVFAPDQSAVIRLIEFEKWTDSIKVRFYDDTEEITKRHITVLHDEFESWLDGAGKFEINEVSDNPHPVTGEHVQTDYSHIIDYPIYLELYLCASDLYEFLIAMGRTRLQYVPE